MFAVESCGNTLWFSGLSAAEIQFAAIANQGIEVCLYCFDNAILCYSYELGLFTPSGLEYHPVHPELFSSP
jgi:hypothetical protein